MFEKKFKYEELSMVPQFFDKGDYFCIFDLKWGYHHNMDVLPGLPMGYMCVMAILWLRLPVMCLQSL